MHGATREPTKINKKPSFVSKLDLATWFRSTLPEGSWTFPIKYSELRLSVWRNFFDVKDTHTSVRDFLRNVSYSGLIFLLPWKSDLRLVNLSVNAANIYFKIRHMREVWSKAEIVCSLQATVKSWGQTKLWLQAGIDLTTGSSPLTTDVLKYNISPRLVSFE